MSKIKIEFIGHACFKLAFGDWSRVVDPYGNGSVPGLDDVQAAALDVLCSHGHHDHNAAHLVKQIRMFAPAPQTKKVKTCHDNEGGAKRGENIVHVFEYEGLKLAHFGDLGHVLTDEQVKEIGEIDVALIPVGGFYTVDRPTAKQIARQLNAKVIIPMHYRTEKFGFDVIGHIDDFTNLFDDVYTIGGSRLEVDKETAPGVYVLTPRAAQ